MKKNLSAFYLATIILALIILSGTETYASSGTGWFSGIARTEITIRLGIPEEDSDEPEEIVNDEETETTEESDSAEETENPGAVETTEENKDPGAVAEADISDKPENQAESGEAAEAGQQKEAGLTEDILENAPAVYDAASVTPKELDIGRQYR